MNDELAFRIAMILLFFGYQIPRTYFRSQARKNRVENELGESTLSESKLRLALMMISGLGANFLGLAYLINPNLFPWSYLDLPDWFRWIGGGIGLLTIVLSYFVHRTLALSFTPTLQTIEGHRLVTDGIYRWIRHPMYTSFFLLFAASALLSASWLIGLLGFIYSLLIIDRVRSEEIMLAENFGRDYHRYQERSGKFFPRIFFTTKTLSKIR
jgi:protein-S-isoprenylcysteine O-methyltransferase Ste14